MELHVNKAKLEKPEASASFQNLSKMRSSGSSLSPPFQSKASLSLPKPKPGPQQVPAADTNPSLGGVELPWAPLPTITSQRMGWGQGCWPFPQHSAGLPAWHSILAPATWQPPDVRKGTCRWLRGNSAAASALFGNLSHLALRWTLSANNSTRHLM